MKTNTKKEKRLAASLPKEPLLIEGQGVASVAMPVIPFTGEALEEALCECGAPFISRILLIQGKASPIQTKRCEGCIAEHEDKQRHEEKQAVTAARIARFESVCPPIYRVTDLERAIKERGLDRAKVKEILDWRPGADGIGLGIIGHSRMIKTRLIYMLARILIVEEGRQVAAINAAKFADSLAAKYGEGPGSAEKWLASLCKVPILFVDDVGKEKMTERAEVAFYRIVEERTSFMLPILFTSNLTSKEMKARMTDEQGNQSDRAEPIAERLREFCRVISFIRRAQD